MTDQFKPTISVIIVNYKVPESLCEALKSLRETQLYDQCEIIVVDNASKDNSRSLITETFPEVQWIQLKNNIGFGKACNAGARQARGEFLLLLNPDTMVSKNILVRCIDFIRKKPNVGMIGPKILNPDGSLQASCRRSFPTPSAALFYFSGLSRLFPKSRRLGQYNLTYMNDNESAEVDAISGSFMFMPLSVFREVEGFDERFFMYGEDIDLCWRIRKKGYTIWYHPDIQIIHTKGKSSTKRIIRSRIAFYEAMIIFTKKYRAHHEGFFPKWFIFFGIVLQASFNIGAILLKTATAAITDTILANSALFAVITATSMINNEPSPYIGDSLLKLVVAHLMLTSCFIFSFLYNGIYSRKHYTPKNGLLSGVLASALFLSLVFGARINVIPYQRYGITLLFTSLLMVGWRETLPRFLSRLKRMIFTPSKIIIIGDGPVTSKLITNFEQKKEYTILGIVHDLHEKNDASVDGYPILGSVHNLKSILEQHNIDTIIVATQHPWYSHIIENIAGTNRRNFDIRWVPQHIFPQNGENIPQTIPLYSFS
ncbi:glycosyl transferase family 2 [Chitinispirillum alkaliphilum]|nr:glycosyl transferase family 2 [Chitinispirillum alkaliphilum]